MKRSFIKLSTFIITIITIVFLVSCGKGYKYPSVIPTLTNKDQAYLTLDNYKITNEQIYRRLIVNNGLDTFNDWLDEILLADIEINETKLEEIKNQTIFGVKNLADFSGNQEETLTKFKNNMKFSGIFTDDELDAYFRLQYRRNQFAKQQLEKDIAEYDDDEPYFSEDVYEAYYKTNYRPTVTTIILTFNSENEALDLLKHIESEINIHLGWKDINGIPYNAKKVKNIFIEIYNNQHFVNNNNQNVLIEGVDYTKTSDDINFNLTNNDKYKFIYTYQELSKISSTIANKVFNDLDHKVLNKSYNYAPLTYSNNIYYLALKIDSTEVQPLDEVRSEIYNALVEQGLTNDVVNRYLYENRAKTNLEIFDEALETTFDLSYKTVHQNLQITAYEAFNRTKAESSKNVASLKFNNTDYHLTADKFFEILTYRFGAQTSVTYMNQHLILTNKDYNSIFNPETGEIFNSAKYEELYKKEVQVYKDELAKGTFASVGIPSNYGWENFLRDYIGVISEADLLANSSLYTDALSKFTKEASKNIGTIDSTDEDTVYYQMKKIYEEFFSAGIFTISVYTDFDLNGIADKEEDYSDDQKALINEFFNKIISEAEKNDLDTLFEKINKVVKEYKISSFNDIKWSEYKKAGLRISISTKTTYTSSSSLNDALKTEIKALWDKIKAEGNIGKSLDKDDLQTISENEFYTPNGYTKVVVLSTTDATYVNKTSNIIFPTSDIIRDYLITQKPDEEKTNEELKVSLTTAEKNAINAYYLPATKVLESSSKTDLRLIHNRNQMITNNKLTFSNSNDLARYQELVAIAKADMK